MSRTKFCKYYPHNHPGIVALPATSKLKKKQKPRRRELYRKMGTHQIKILGYNRQELWKMGPKKTVITTLTIVFKGLKVDPENTRP